MRQILFHFCTLLFSQFIAAQCPLIFQLSNQDLQVCEMENFIFTAQFDDESLATVNWTLPDGSVESTFALGYFFDSSTGCNEVLDFGYEVLCEDGSVLETGSFTVTIYTFNEAIVEAAEDCTYTILPDCPDDVEIVVDGSVSNMYQAVQGTQGNVLVEITNTDAPDDCKYNTFSYNFDCTQEIGTGIDALESEQWARVQSGGLLELLVETEVEELALFDLSGKNLWNKKLGSAGQATGISISSSITGICILVLRTTDGIYSQKLFLQ